MQPISVSAQIEILAAPAAVRSVFFDFARYEHWANGWNITLADTSKKPSELAVGDSVKVNMHGLRFNPIVAENSPHLFTWTGSFWGLFVGTHHFSFEPSKVNPGGTTFIQMEEFTGPLTIIYWPWRNTESKPSVNWQDYNAALKKEVENSSL